MKNRPPKNVKYLVDRLLSALGELSDRDLMLLREVLEDSGTRNSLIKTLDHRAYLRMHEIKQRKENNYFSDANSLQDIAPETFNKYYFEMQSEDDIGDVIRHILSDRELFPSTQDVIHAISNIFDVHFEHQKFKKSGRDRLISAFLSVFSEQPRGRQRSKLMRLLKMVRQRPSSTDEYSELFRMLTKNE